MSTPPTVPGPTPLPTPTSVPSDIQTRMAALLARMGTRGMTEHVTVYGEQTQFDASGKPVARARVALGTITGYVATGGGSLQLAQEGTRSQLTHTLYFVPDGSGLLVEANYPQRWVQLTARSAALHRVTDCQSVGPYMWALLEAGGTSDTAGNVK